MRDSITLNLSIHHLTPEDYAKLEFPEQERDGTRWKTMDVGQHIHISFFKPHKEAN